jgi:hypothetical protein
MKCKDCGSRDYEPSRSRSDICVTCMDLRLRLAQGFDRGAVSVEQMQAVQHSMNSDYRRRGHGAAKMREVLSEPTKQVQCADCLQWIDADRNHTCVQQVARNRAR